MSQFELVSEYELTGDQPRAVEALVDGIDAGKKAQVLLGVTGSGKTFSMANVIARTQRPTLIIAHNKTLAAQLYAEFRELFPRNAVEYFVSYYDYYQPEAYIPRTDTYIEKDAMINERIDKMRHSATRSLLDRQDVIIVASVSCIYGLGSPEAYHQMLVYLEKGMTIDRDAVLAKLIEIQYKRSDAFLERARFRVRGDVLDVFPVYEDSKVVRVEFFGDEVDNITLVDPLTGEILEELFKTTIYPASHYVQPQERLEGACAAIEAELEQRLPLLREKGKLLEAQRLEQRTRYDLEMIREIGFCSGIENYSRHLEGRLPGSTPPTLMDYLPSNALIIIDESHATVPQIGGMYRGDQSRKNVLVDFGFRLESALDNRPLKFEEFEAIANRLSIVFVSATPSKYELERAGGITAEQIIRPTGLIDPEIEVRPARGQVDDLLDQARGVIEAGHRVLVTTLTKRMAEDLTEYYRDCGINVRYLHADIETIERTELIKQLRLGEYDVLVGINLLREGLDIPEVALVGVLDADKEGFLRSSTSLIQTAGRAARNVDSRVLFYADKITDSMKAAMDETARRRVIQTAYNEKHGIIPTTIRSRIKAGIEALYDADYVTVEPDLDNRINAILARADDSLKSRKGRAASKKAQSQQSQTRGGAKGKTKTATAQGAADGATFTSELTTTSIPKRLTQLRDEMGKAAKRLEFELAAQIRDEIRELEQLQMELL